MADAVSSLQDFAERIVSAPGFSHDNQGIETGVKEWLRLLPPEWPDGWDHRALIAKFLIEVSDNYRSRVRAIRASEKPDVDREPHPPTQVKASPPAKLAARYSSESPDYAVSAPKMRVVPAAPAPAAVPDAPPVKVVAVRPDPDLPAPVVAPAQVVVQQESRKVRSYRSMYPQLTRPVHVAAGEKSLGRCRGADLGFITRSLDLEERSQESLTATDEAGIVRREEANAVARTRIAQRKRRIEEIRAERERVARCREAVLANGDCMLEELPPAVLDELGFARKDPAA